MVRWKRDVIYGIALLVACLLCIIETRDLPTGTAKIFAARADVYVWFWVGILALLSALLIINALRKKDNEMLSPIWNSVGVTTVIAMFGYLLVMEALGFTISSFLFLFVVVLAYARRMGKLEKKGKQLASTLGLYAFACLVATIVTEQIFRNGLDVLLPQFSLF